MHYTFPDKELVEEYDVHSGLLLGTVISLISKFSIDYYMNTYIGLPAIS
jgi:hypothetical protein